MNKNFTNNFNYQNFGQKKKEIDIDLSFLDSESNLDGGNVSEFDVSINTDDFINLNNYSATSYMNTSYEMNFGGPNKKPNPPTKQHGGVDFGASTKPKPPSKQHGGVDFGASTKPKPPTKQHGGVDFGASTKPKPKPIIANQFDINNLSDTSEFNFGGSTTKPKHPRQTGGGNFSATSELDLNDNNYLSVTSEMTNNYFKNNSIQDGGDNATSDINVDSIINVAKNYITQKGGKDEDILDEEDDDDDSDLDDEEDDSENKQSSKSKRSNSISSKSRRSSSISSKSPKARRSSSISSKSRRSSSKSPKARRSKKSKSKSPKARRPKSKSPKARRSKSKSKKSKRSINYLSDSIASLDTDSLVKDSDTYHINSSESFGNSPEDTPYLNESSSINTSSINLVSFENPVLTKGDKKNKW